MAKWTVINMAPYDPKTMGFKLPSEMRAVDGHLHAQLWTEGQSEGFDNFIEAFEAYRKENNLLYGNFAAISFHGAWDASNNVLGAILKLRNPNFFVHGCLVHPRLPITRPIPAEFRFTEQVREMMEMGFDGIKMLEGKPDERARIDFSFLEPEFDELFSCLEEKQIPLLWHVNDPDEFWDRSKLSPRIIELGWCYDRPECKSYEETYEEVYEVLKRHPDLKVTFAHFFFMSKQPDRLVELFNTYPNVAVDLTPGGEMYIEMTKQWQRWKEIFTRFPERFLLGTDITPHWGLKDETQHLNSIYRFLLTEDEYLINENPVHGLGLKEETVGKVLSGNFLHRVGNAPREIDKEILFRYAEKVLPLAKNREHAEFVRAYLKKLKAEDK